MPRRALRLLPSPRFLRIAVTCVATLYFANLALSATARA